MLNFSQSALMCRWVSLEQDSNTRAITSSVSPWYNRIKKSSDSRFFIEQISSENRAMQLQSDEQSNCTSNRRLFCKYPSSTSHSKMLRRLPSRRRSINNDLHKFISWTVKVCEKVSLADKTNRDRAVAWRQFSQCDYSAPRLGSNFAPAMLVVLIAATGGAAVDHNTQTAHLSFVYDLQTHLISNSHVLSRRSPSSIPKYSTLGRQKFYYYSKQKTFRIPFA
jgi:hypothetical protein